jgi:hypothetical protein
LIAVVVLRGASFASLLFLANSLVGLRHTVNGLRFRLALCSVRAASTVALRAATTPFLFTRSRAVCPSKGPCLKHSIGGQPDSAHCPVESNPASVFRQRAKCVGRPRLRAGGCNPAERRARVLTTRGASDTPENHWNRGARPERPSKPFHPQARGSCQAARSLVWHVPFLRMGVMQRGRPSGPAACVENSTQFGTQARRLDGNLSTSSNGGIQVPSAAAFMALTRRSSN